MLTFNEGKVCEAIIRYLEAREKETRREVHSPESTNDDDPVELIWKLGTQLYALEHTGIEPFDGHLKLEAEARHHFEPIKTALTDIVSNDIIELHVPAKAMLGRSKADVAQIQTAIITWVRQQAPALERRSYANYIGDIRWVSVPDVPFAVRLFRFENLTPKSGWIQVVHSLGSNREQERMDRLRRACDKKFPKLAAWKRKHGARTVFVLEENDIQLTNYAVVADTYTPLAQGRPDRPDETYLVSTCVEPWSAWPLLIGDKTLSDLRVDDYVPRWEIDHTSLIPATPR